METLTPKVPAQRIAELNAVEVVRSGAVLIDQDGKLVFTNCNVCGSKLRNKAEDRMGMCIGCAAQ